MSETWVHGDVFVPRQYGPGQLINVGGLDWTDQQGLKDGDQARFIVHDERINWFNAMIPVVGQQQLLEVQVEFASRFAPVHSAWVHAGHTYVVSTDQPDWSNHGSNFSVLRVREINQQVSRGLCVSLAFSTYGVGVGPSEIAFFGAGAIFA